MTNPGGYHNGSETKLVGSNQFPGVVFQRPCIPLSYLFRDYVVDFNLLLGHGGFGQVFAGERRSDKRQAAIKVLLKEELHHWIDVRHVTFINSKPKDDSTSVHILMRHMLDPSNRLC